MRKVLITICVLIAIYASFVAGVQKGIKRTRLVEKYVRLTKDIDFAKDKLGSIPMFDIQGSIKSGSIGIWMRDPNIKTANKTVYFPITIPYDKKEYYEVLDIPVPK